MQTSLLFVVSGIHKLSPITKRSCFAHQKGDIHVQDCIRRPPSLQHAVRPLDGLDRPFPDREQPHRHSQRRPPPFWSLTPRLRGFQRRKPAGARASPISIHVNGPGLRGHFHVRWRVAQNLRRLRQISRFGNDRQKQFAWWHIIYKNASNARYQQARAHQGMGTCSPQRTAIAIWGRKDRQCVHASALRCAFQSTIGQKERMPRRLVPRIQFQPATVLMRQSLRRDDQGWKKTRNF